MPYSAAFSSSQTLGVPQSINFTDLSTGSDAAIASRRIYLQKDDGTFLVQQGTTTEYEVWALSVGNTITLNVFTKDYALLQTVQWLDVSGNILYAVQAYAGFTLYNEQFDYQLTQWLAGTPLNVNDNNFFDLKSELRDCIDSGNQAIQFFSDLYAAQQCYDRGTAIRLKSQYLFNSNS